MTPCSRCQIALKPGSAHFNAEACVEALKHELAEATNCKACGQPVAAVLHAGCIPAEVARRGAGLGTKIVEQRILDWLAGDPRKKRKQDDPDRPRPRQRADGDDFDP